MKLLTKPKSLAVPRS